MSFFATSPRTSVCLTSFRLMWCFTKRSLTGADVHRAGPQAASCVSRQCPAEGVRQRMIPPKAAQDHQPLHLQRGTPLAFNLIDLLNTTHTARWAWLTGGTTSLTYQYEDESTHLLMDQRRSDLSKAQLRMTALMSTSHLIKPLCVAIQ